MTEVARARPDTIAAALPRELVRVAKLAQLCALAPDPLASDAARTMDDALDRAVSAMGEGDLAGMIGAYRDLTRFQP